MTLYKLAVPLPIALPFGAGAAASAQLDQSIASRIAEATGGWFCKNYN